MLYLLFLTTIKQPPITKQVRLKQLFKRMPRPLLGTYKRLLGRMSHNTQHNVSITFVLAVAVNKTLSLQEVQIALTLVAKLARTMRMQA